MINSTLLFSFIFISLSSFAVGEKVSGSSSVRYIPKGTFFEVNRRIDIPPTAKFVWLQKLEMTKTDLFFNMLNSAFNELDRVQAVEKELAYRRDGDLLYYSFEDLYTILTFSYPIHNFRMSALRVVSSDTESFIPGLYDTDSEGNEYKDASRYITTGGTLFKEKVISLPVDRLTGHDWDYFGIVDKNYRKSDFTNILVHGNNNKIVINGDRYNRYSDYVAVQKGVRFKKIYIKEYIIKLSPINKKNEIMKNRKSFAISIKSRSEANQVIKIKELEESLGGYSFNISLPSKDNRVPEKLY